MYNAHLSLCIVEQIEFYCVFFNVLKKSHFDTLRKNLLIYNLWR